MIKNWQQFNESYDNQEQKDLEAILNYIAQNISSKEIPALKKDLQPLLTESLNEGFFSDLKDRLIKWFDEKIMNYIVNKKKRFYTELIGKLDLFDLTTLGLKGVLLKKRTIAFLRFILFLSFFILSPFFT